MKKNDNKDSTVMTKKRRNDGWNRIEEVLHYLHVIIRAGATVHMDKIMKYISQYIWTVCI